jgi:hypothetical protein
MAGLGGSTGGVRPKKWDKDAHRGMNRREWAAFQIDDARYQQEHAELRRLEDKERFKKVSAIRRKLLAKIEKAKQEFSRNGCEDHEGSAFDCWMLDQFNALAETVKRDFNMASFKLRR